MKLSLPQLTELHDTMKLHIPIVYHVHTQIEMGRDCGGIWAVIQYAQIEKNVQVLLRWNNLNNKWYKK